jgi:adenylate cyclase class 2
MQAPEIELKFPVNEIEAFLERVGTLAFQLETPRTFESNTLYDTPDRSLKERRQLLRVRHYGARCTVTHKRMSDSGEDGSRYKTRIETESIVEDGDALAEIFTRLGYGPVFRYEKYRTEWAVASGGHLVLDETPIGVYAELEGEPAWIDAMLAALGVDPASCLTESYGKLFLAWKEKTGSPAENLTFEEAGAVEAH